MGRTTTQIVGIEELRRRLKATPRIARALVADRIVRPTATDTAARAVGLVPVDEGDLARAITVEGRGLRYRVGVEGGPVGGRTGQASHTTPAVYGARVEYGSVQDGPQPFMRPAAEYGGRLLEARTRAVAADLASDVSRA